MSKHKSLLDDSNFHPGWQFFDYQMPDGVHDIFQAPDEKTADKWASRHWAQAQKAEAKRLAQLAVTRSKIQAAEDKYKEHVHALYEQNLKTGTFVDVDESFAVQEVQDVPSDSPPRQTTLEATPRKVVRKKLQKETFLDALFA